MDLPRNIRSKHPKNFEIFCFPLLNYELHGGPPKFTIYTCKCYNLKDFMWFKDLWSDKGMGFFSEVGFLKI